MKRSERSRCERASGRLERPEIAPRAFTLIELLVVVTIIIVLLALLTPALDKAIYQAELATCGANLNATAKGLNIYAMDFKRSYPYRQALTSGTVYGPWQLTVGATDAGAQPAKYDDRVPLKGYVDLKPLVDPLCKRVDLNTPDAWIYASYSLWFGWQFKEPAPTGGKATIHEGMTKVGNRMTWIDKTVAPQKEQSVNWLVTDIDDITPSYPYDICSHPDRDGFLHNMAIEDGGKDDPSAAVQANNNLSSETGSRWVQWKGWDRGKIDVNAASADGAVIRYNDVDSNPEGKDDRFAHAPPTPDGTSNGTSWYTPGAANRSDGTRLTSVPRFWINVPIR